MKKIKIETEIDLDKVMDSVSEKEGKKIAKRFMLMFLTPKDILKEYSTNWILDDMNKTDLFRYINKELKGYKLVKEE